MELYTDVAEQYADFGAYAVDSPCFADWARRVADDRALLTWIGRLPYVKQQPNLVFAAARWHGVPAPGRYDVLREALLGDDGAIETTIRTRSTQTNEAGRLATLTPFLTEIAAATGRPLALVEAGASAGLCLHPDRWSYAWHTDRGVIEAGAGPRLDCEVIGELPATLGFEVGWRGGVDLHPLDVDDDDAMAWLETLVWPEQHARRGRLRAAVEIARTDPPRLVAGDLVAELPGLVEQAATYGEVVVFHSAVIAYLEPEARERFAELMTGLVNRGACRWISNEGPGVLPLVTATAGGPVPSGRFVLGVDGRARALTHGHGASMQLF